MSYIPPAPPSKPQAYILTDFVNEVVDPNLMIIRDISSKEVMWSPESRHYALTIALQETGLRYRKQHPTGPGRGFWQFEGGPNQALDLLIRHDVVGPWLHEYATSVVLPFTRDGLYAAIPYHDGLALILTRLLLYTDYRQLIMDQDVGWQIYMNCWQPGEPHPENWPDNWERALEALTDFAV